MTWLENSFPINEHSTEEDLKRAARAYILHMLGGMLMPDKSTSMVHTQYLPFLEDFEYANSYSWGSAVLAFLYREMCKASKIPDGRGRGRMNVDIGGCMVLLQCWAYYRLPFLAPIVAEPQEFPLAMR